MSDDLNITCPCCATQLLLDRETGEILSEERPAADHDKTFEDAMQDVNAGANRREKAFSDAYKRTTNLETLLEKKFEEARKKAAKDDSKPVNPLDFD
jgi:hypothetical protein